MKNIPHLDGGIHYPVVVQPEQVVIPALRFVPLQYRPDMLVRPERCEIVAVLLVTS